jgi:hypothetical protein
MKLLSMLVILMLFCLPAMAITDHPYMGNDVSFTTMDAEAPATLLTIDPMNQSVIATDGSHKAEVILEEQLTLTRYAKANINASLVNYNEEVQCVSRADHSNPQTTDLIPSDKNTKGANLQTGNVAFIRRE